MASIDRLRVSGLLRKPLPDSQMRMPRSASINNLVDLSAEEAQNAEAKRPFSGEASPPRGRKSLRDHVPQTLQPPFGQHWPSMSSPSRIRQKFRSNRSGGNSADLGTGQPSRAWVLSPNGERPGFDLTPLESGAMVSELWNPNGDVYVHLFPGADDGRASFKVDSSIFSSSIILTTKAHGRLHSHSRQSSGQLQRPVVETTQVWPLAATTPLTESTIEADEEIPRELHLHLPICNPEDVLPESQAVSTPELDSLLSVRNLFAFLACQPLVASDGQADIFEVLMKIAALLAKYEFSNCDGSTYGEVAETSFRHYLAYFGLLDVRNSRQKTIEAIILGECMRSSELYNEGFVHGVGKYDVLVDLDSPKFQLISTTTRNRMERSSIELLRLIKATHRLESFDIPSMFSGIASSTTIPESQQTSLRAWKSAYLSTRKFALSYYKDRFGSWPPKAKSKKNEFLNDGLNRLVLKVLYEDLSDLYDLLVDRKSLTTRSADIPFTGIPESTNTDSDEQESYLPPTLRTLLSEYDRSLPPVLPPIPFDLPLLPCLPPTLKEKNNDRTRKLKNTEIGYFLLQACNMDTYKQKAETSNFLRGFLAFEKKIASGKNISQLLDMRTGQWVFLYAVLQALPMVVVDAPGINFTDGVEYFLCQPPKGSVPWVKEFSQQKSWYEVDGGRRIVNLPKDVVEMGVDGVYRRSHCWQMAQVWIDNLDLPQSPLSEPLPPFVADFLGGSPGLVLSEPFSDSDTGSNRQSRRRSSLVGWGLEPLPMPPNIIAADSASSSPLRPASPFSRTPSPFLEFPAARSSIGGSVLSAPTEHTSLSGAGLAPTTPREFINDPSKTFDTILDKQTLASPPQSRRRKSIFFGSAGSV